MIRKLFLYLFIILMISCEATKTNVAHGPVVANVPFIIPQPQMIRWKKEYFKIPESNTICYSKGADTTALWLHKLLQVGGVNAKLTEGASCGNWNIVLDKDLEGDLGIEGYQLEIVKDGVSIKAAFPAGIFYAIQSIRQLLPAEIEQGHANLKNFKLLTMAIQDYPRYEWRGTMIDLARSYVDLEYLKMHLDRMALYKLNRLHLHLTDDQGWRIEIKKWPELTEIGAKGAVKNGRSGFLTQEQYKELQEYALARNIIIIPEIDMPGHIYSALVSYPQLNCETTSNIDLKIASPPNLYSGYKVGWNKLCLENPGTYQFVSEVMEEISEITVGPWIHLGGDEVEDPLYKEFVVKADSIVRSYDKISIGWEEVTQAAVDESLISQTWHGTIKSVVDVKIIESICQYFYFDHGNFKGQENTQNWCGSSGITLADIYSYTSDNVNVIGVEAPVWTEFVLQDKVMDNRFWPRTIALAEVAWTNKKNKDFVDFKNRLKYHGQRLNGMGIHFHKSQEVEWFPGITAESNQSVFSNYLSGN